MPAVDKERSGMTSPIHPKPSSDKKRTAVLTLGLLVALVAAGLYFFDPIDRVRALSADVPREKVTLALGREPLAALAMIALDQKFFERAGLDVAVKKYNSGGLALKGFLAGEAER